MIVYDSVEVVSIWMPGWGEQSHAEVTGETVDTSRAKIAPSPVHPLHALCVGDLGELGLCRFQSGLQPANARVAETTLSARGRLRLRRFPSPFWNLLGCHSVTGDLPGRMSKVTFSS